MSKLNIIEAMKMPIGTEFEVKASIENCTCPNMYIYAGIGEAILKLKNGDFVLATESVLSATFIPIQQPVSFMEAINSGKRVKVVHDRVIRSRYMTITDLFEFMANGAHDFPIVLINEGKWYTDERGELEDERLS